MGRGTAGETVNTVLMCQSYSVFVGWVVIRTLNCFSMKTPRHHPCSSEAGSILGCVCLYMFVWTHSMYSIPHHVDFRMSGAVCIRNIGWVSEYLIITRFQWKTLQILFIHSFNGNLLGNYFYDSYILPREDVGSRALNKIIYSTWETFLK